MDDTIDWLMEGDPAIRWQVQRDLLDRAESTWKRERARVARDGWGADLLALQDDNGGWSGAVYSPKWTSTHYTLLQLLRLGLPPDHPAGRRGLDRLLRAARFQEGGINFAKTVPVPDGCVNGMVLLMASYFGVTGPVPDGVMDWILGRQMPDGGWNCEDWRGATHGSFHTTISVLEGLEEFRLANPGKGTPIVQPAESARQFLLAHRLYKSHRTGEIADPVFTMLSFPPRWHYDVLPRSRLLRRGRSRSRPPLPGRHRPGYQQTEIRWHLEAPEPPPGAAPLLHGDGRPTESLEHPESAAGVAVVGEQAVGRKRHESSVASRQFSLSGS